VDQVVTVSPGIAELYSKRHSVVASVVPNWVPLSHEVSSSADANLPIKFVYMGHAAPHRGLEDLIQKWGASMDQATLDLFIPERPYTQSLRTLIEKCTRGESNLKITLNPPVPSDQMIETLTRFDVGIIPYDHPYPYSHCSPNKLGQYLAAGLAVISNELPFVLQTIESAHCGAVFKWSELGSFERVVHDICNASDLSELKANSRKAFHESFNWDLSVKEFANSTNAFQNFENEGPDDFWQQVFADASRIKIEGNLIAMIPEMHQDSRFNLIERLKGLDLQENIQLRRLFGRLQRIPLVGSITKAFAKRIL
jgi:glycosyltransferase involved in cell wall biosynthesis